MFDRIAVVVQVGGDRVSADEASSSDANQQKKAPPVTDGAEWRRRASRDPFANHYSTVVYDNTIF